MGGGRNIHLGRRPSIWLGWVAWRDEKKEKGKFEKGGEIIAPTAAARGEGEEKKRRRRRKRKKRVGIINPLSQSDVFPMINEKDSFSRLRPPLPSRSLPFPHPTYLVQGVQEAAYHLGMQCQQVALVF